MQSYNCVVKLPKEEFESIVYQKLNSLPKEIREKLENIEVFVEPDPPAPAILGFYHGVPFPHRKTPAYSFVLPDKIILYQNPIERMCRNRDALEKKVEEVLLHEIGHYLGLGEAELRKLKI